jgi:hypothetical protein
MATPFKARDGKFPFLAEVRQTRKEVLEEDALLNG